MCFKDELRRNILIGCLEQPPPFFCTWTLLIIFLTAISFLAPLFEGDMFFSQVFFSSAVSALWRTLFCFSIASYVFSIHSSPSSAGVFWWQLPLITAAAIFPMYRREKLEDRSFRATHGACKLWSHNE